MCAQDTFRCNLPRRRLYRQETRLFRHRESDIDLHKTLSSWRPPPFGDVVKGLEAREDVRKARVGDCGDLIVDHLVALGVICRVRCVLRVPADDRVGVSQSMRIETSDVEGWEGEGEEGKGADD